MCRLLYDLYELECYPHNLRINFQKKKTLLRTMISSFYQQQLHDYCKLIKNIEIPCYLRKWFVWYVNAKC